MSWTLDHLEDIESDMSVFHRVDDLASMPAHRFFRFAERLPAYGGAVAIALRHVERQARPVDPAPAPKLPAPGTVDVRQQALMAPDWVQIVSA